MKRTILRAAAALVPGVLLVTGLHGAGGRAAPPDAPPAPALFGHAAETSPAPDDVVVPGGPDAIRRLLNLDTARPRETFFVELHDALLAGAESRAGWSQVDRRRAVVEFAEDLEAWRREFGAQPALSTAPAAWPRTLRALEWLGLDVDGDAGEFSTQGREDRDSLRRRAFPDALGTPMAVLLSRLRAGEAVTLAAADSTAPMPFGLVAWRGILGQPALARETAFLELVRSVAASRLLVALHALDAETRKELLAIAGREKGKNGASELLSEELLAPLARFPGAVAIAGGAFSLPGGKAAEPVWSEVFGVSPGRRGPFLRALLTTDGGKGAYVVDALQQLPETHVRELLLGRAKDGESAAGRFRRLYRSIERMGEGFATGHRDPYDFAQLAWTAGPDSAGALSLAADVDGEEFPADETKLAELLTAARRRDGGAATAGDGLGRLLQREAERGSGTGVLRRFAVAWSLASIEPALAEPATFALLLRGADRFFPAYAPLEDLPLAGAAGRRYLFALDRLDRRERSRDTEVESGLLQASVELVALARRSGSLPPDRAAELVASVLDVSAFAGSDAPPGAAGPALAAWLSDRLLPALAGPPEAAEPDESADERLSRGLVGPAAPAVFAWRGGHYRYDPADDELRRRREFREKQRLASLADVIAAARARAALVGKPEEGPGKAAAAELVELLGLEPDGPAEPDERVKARLARAHQSLRVLASGAGRPAETEAVDAAISERLLEAMLGHVYAAWAGDPADLYYEDPGFVRRHSFRSVARGGRLRETPFAPTRLIPVFGGGGSRVSGSVFGLPDVLGLLHADQLTYGPGASLVNEQIRSGLVGVVRRVSASRIDDDALRFLEASCRATEELAAGSPEIAPPDRLRLWSALAGDLVSRARLSRVGTGPVSVHLAPSDLYRIGRRLALGPLPAGIDAPPSAGEARSAHEALVRRLGEKGAREKLAELGPRAVAWAGRFRLTDLDLPSYERLASYRMPGLLSDRLYDFKVTVARTVAQAGLPAGVLPLILQAALDEMMGKLTMGFAYDWRAIVRRSQAFGPADLERFLEGALSAGRLARDHSRDEGQP